MTSEQVRDFIFCNGAQELDPYKIAPTLERVWKEFQSQREEQACMRLRTMNLLVVCSKPRDALDLRNEMRQLAHLYPGRFVAVVLDPDYEGPLRGWYSTESLPGHPEQLGCELIGLHSPSDGQPLPSLLAPLWLQGLPLFLWWRGRAPYGQPWFNHLLEASRRILLDTGGFGALSRKLGQAPDAAEPLARIAELVDNRYHQELAFTDLNWGRMRTWREMLASLFDSHECIQALGGLQEIEMVTWALPRDITPSLQGLYVAGWLMRQLRLDVVTPLLSHDEGQSAVLRSPHGHEVRLEVRYQPVHDQDLVARLAAVSFRGQVGESGFRLSVERDSQDCQTLLRSGHTSQPIVGNALQLCRLNNQQILALEFEQFGRDVIYEGSLRRALALAGVAPVATPA